MFSLGDLGRLVPEDDVFLLLFFGCALLGLLHVRHRLRDILPALHSKGVAR